MMDEMTADLNEAIATGNAAIEVLEELTAAKLKKIDVLTASIESKIA